MTPSVMPTTGPTEPLDAQTSAEVLDTAVSLRAEVAMRPGSDEAIPPCIGRFLRCERTQIALEMDPLPRGATDVSVGGSLLASFVIDGRRYSFTTALLRRVRGAAGPTWIVARPEAICNGERRRSPRRRFCKQAEVILSRLGEEPSCFVGQMLNLSEHGLACRAPAQAVEELRVGELVRVQFTVGATPQTFDVIGRVINVTPGGHADRLVLGIQLVLAESECAAIARVLSAGGDAA